jgi:hypothetical protein
MIQPVIAASANAELDILLECLCVALQLTETLYQDAQQKYRAVARWLSQPGSPLVLYEPDIYPQGSMLLLTTVKPRTHEEYDVDLVCLLRVDRYGCSSMALYEAVARRLMAHDTYRKILERMKRCLRLNYAGQLHLDILPACPNIERGGTAIWVPDRKLEGWKESDPKGYGNWFARCALREGRVIKARVEPLPPNQAAHDKAPLRRTVQLLKRRRDVVFNGSDLAPRSVILTTLAGHHYGGHDLCADALETVLAGIVRQIEATPGVIQVLNPVNSAEDFGESLNERSYSAFVDYVDDFRDRLGRLSSISGIDHIAQALGDLFGETVVHKAVDLYAERYSSARESGALRVAGPLVGLTTSVTHSRPVPKHTFYGSEEDIDSRDS